MRTARDSSRAVDGSLCCGFSKGIYYLKYSITVILVEGWWLYSISMGVHLQLKYLHLTAVLGSVVK